MYRLFQHSCSIFFVVFKHAIFVEATDGRGRNSEPDISDVSDDDVIVSSDDPKICKILKPSLTCGNKDVKKTLLTSKPELKSAFKSMKSNSWNVLDSRSVATSSSNTGTENRFFQANLRDTETQSSYFSNCLATNCNPHSDGKSITQLFSNHPSASNVNALIQQV